MRARRLVVLALGLLAAAPLAAAQRAEVTLSAPLSGSEWLGWNQSGRCTVPLPAGWSFYIPYDRSVRVLLDDGTSVELPPGERLRATAPARVEVRASTLRGRLAGGMLEVSATADRLDFPGGAEMECRGGVFEPAGRARVQALSMPSPQPWSFEYEGELVAQFSRIEWVSGEEASPARLLLPGRSSATDDLVAELGLWSPEGLYVDWSSADDRLRLSTSDLGWARIDGDVLRPRPPVLQAPLAEVRVRAASLRPNARRVLRCRLIEPTGLLAPDVHLVAEGAPNVVMFDRADTPVGLDRFLASLAAERSAGGEPEDLGLAVHIREYLLPLWYGLWFDTDSEREEIRDTPTLTEFARNYNGAVAAARPELQAWLAAGQTRHTSSLAKPEPFAAALQEAVQHLSRGDRYATVWWSIFLSDVLSTLADSPVIYWQADGHLVGAGESPGTVSLTRVLEWAESGRPTLIQQRLRDAAEAHVPVNEVQLERLGADSDLPLDIILNVGRSQPTGRYEARLQLSSGGAAVATVPLVVHVEPSWASIALLSLAVLLPAGLVLLMLLLALRRKRDEAAARRAMLRHLQARYGAWQRFRQTYAPALKGKPQNLDEALARFTEWGLHEALTPELFGQYLRVRSEPQGAAAFFRAVEQHFQALGQGTESKRAGS